MTDSSQKQLTLAELPSLRRRTESTAQLLHDQLVQHLEVLRPLLAPERLLGKLVGVKTEVVGADVAYAELQKRYKDFAGSPYGLAADLEAHVLTLIGTRLKLSRWEYVHQASANGENVAITMTSTVRWVLSYGSNYTEAQAKAVLAGKEASRPEYLRQFVVNALVLNQVVTKNPGLVQLLADLRYEVKTDFSPELGPLPLVTIACCLPSFRPADDLLVAATGFSGVPAFIELLDLDAVAAIQDPLKKKIESMLE